MVKEMVKELKVHVELGPEPTKGVTKVTLPADLNDSYHRQILKHYGETDEAKIKGPLSLVVQPNKQIDAALAGNLSAGFKNLKSITVSTRDGIIEITSMLSLEVSDNETAAEPSESRMAMSGDT